MPVLFQDDPPAAFPILSASLKPFSFSPAHWLPLRVQWNQYHRGKSVIRQTISCDICGADKKESNHWFVALEREGEIRLGTWAALGRRRSGARHLCGQKCLYKLVDDFFVRRALGLRPSTDLPAEVSGNLALSLPDGLSAVLPPIQPTAQPELPREGHSAKSAQPTIPPAPRSGGHRARPQRSTPAAVQPVAAMPVPAAPVPVTPVRATSVPATSAPAASARKKTTSGPNPAQPNATGTSGQPTPAPAVRSTGDFPDLDSPLAPPRSTRIHRDGAGPRRESAIPAARAAARRSSASTASPASPAAGSRLSSSHLRQTNHPQTNPAQPAPASPSADEYGSSARLIPTPPDRLARHAAEAAERARAWRPAMPPSQTAAAHPQQVQSQQAQASQQQTRASQQQAHQQQAAEAAHAAADRRRILDAWQRERAREQGTTLRNGTPANPRSSNQLPADSRPPGRSPSRLTAMLRPRILEA